MRHVMNGPDIGRALTRIAHEIVERDSDVSDLVVLGIPTRGVALGRRLVDNVEAITGIPVEVGILDVAPFRDDQDRRADVVEPAPRAEIEVEARKVILVDDVLYTGRTVRAAFDALTHLGRAAAVRLAVLIDRGHREFPIRADFVGKNLPTAPEERVTVQLVETDGSDGVWIEPAGYRSPTPAAVESGRSP